MIKVAHPNIVFLFIPIIEVIVIIVVQI
jgi:hypothetical protein